MTPARPVTLLCIMAATKGLYAEAFLREARALGLVPGLAQAEWNLGLAELALGDFSAGWAHFERRWTGCPTLQGSYRFPPERAWQGEALAGKRLLLWAEQGLGDTLQFIRYASLAAAAGATVWVEVQPPLVGLLRSVAGASEVHAFGEGPDRWDFHCPLMSLPYRFATTLETIPAAVPYLTADASAVARWRERLAALPGLKVGLVWAGGARPGRVDLEAIDARRSLKLAALAPLAAVPGVQLVSLQKGPAAAEVAQAPFSLVDWSDEWQNFADTAALVEALDLVISVDTAVAHLAGALGRPVWMLNRLDTCWRWLLERNDTPWYPSMRLFRQRESGAWDEVIAGLVTALSAQVAGRP